MPPLETTTDRLLWLLLVATVGEYDALRRWNRLREKLDGGQ